jgi:hypothetical protein
MNDLNRTGVDRGHRLFRRRRWLEATVPGVGEGTAELAEARARAVTAPAARRAQQDDDEPPPAA